MKGISEAAMRYQAKLCQAVQCICCRVQKLAPARAEAECTDTLPGCYMRALPLCQSHRDELRDSKTRFHAKYGKQADLQAECNRILDRSGKR